MSPRVLLFVQRLALLAALGVSSALLVDYLRPVPAFCGLGSGCSEVRLSSFSHPLGVPLPLAGVLGFGSLAAATLAASSSIRRVATWLTLLSGAGGALLLTIQSFVLHVFCVLCVITDATAMLAAVAALGAAWASSRLAVDDADDGAKNGAKKGTPGDDPRKSPDGESPWPWLVALALVVVAPVAWGKLTPAPAIPREVGALWAPGKINVVEFADFECPFCRELHPILKSALAQYGDRVHLVRLNMPLAMHPHARDASRAYLCADAQGKGEAMADGLFAAALLTPEADRAVAQSVGVLLADYDACISDGKIDARIDEQMRVVRATDFKGLPTVWIGETRLVGLGPKEGYEQALADAAGKLGSPPVTPSRPQ